MDGIQICGIICGALALFFALVAGMTYMKIKKLFTLIDESQYEAIMPFVEKQRKRVYFEALLCVLLTIATAVLSVINGLM